MLRIFVRQLLLRSFSPIRTSYLKNIVNASLYCRYCTSANVEVADKIASKNIPGNYDVKSIEQLKRIFKCTDEEAKRVFQQIDPLDLKLLRKKFLFLTKNGATLPVLMDHCHLLNMSTVDLLHKFKLLRYLSWRKTDDFIPFLAVSKPKLKVAKMRDLSERVYYLSEKLKVDPPIVSMYLSKHSFMWAIEFDVIKNKLELLMKYSQYLSPINILRDLDIFQRNKEIILERFNRIESTTVIKKTMPWMVKCPEETLNRTIELSMERGEFLNYLAKRLDWSIQTTNKIQKEFPRLKSYKEKCKNVAEVIDILLPRFGAATVTDNINLVMKWPKLIARRCNQLQSAGIPLNETTVRLLFMRRPQFNNYLETHGLTMGKKH